MAEIIGRVGWRTFVPTNNPLWDNLLAYWSGDNTANDSKGTANGTLVNGATYSTGKIGSGFSLDGVNDYVGFSSTWFRKSKTEPFTISSWVNMSVHYGTIFSNGNDDGHWVFFHSQYIYFQIGANGGNYMRVVSASQIPLNTFKHITITYNGSASPSGVKIYIDGVSVTVNTAQDTLAPYDTPAIPEWGLSIPRIGTRANGSYPFAGVLDELGIWSRALTAAEATELYNSGAGKQYVAPAPTQSYLLDTYTSATTAYSLRKLSSTYTGNAIRVRRSSDNTEQNIGFDGSGNLDTTTLLAFVGAGNGFVTTWYNQSGDTSNNNPSWPGYTNKTMIQTSAANQPIIVTSGVVELKSGKPTIKFSANKYLKLPIIGLTNTLMFDGADHSFFAVYEKDTTANVSNFIGYNVGYLWLDYGGTQYDGNNSVSGTIPANTTKLISLSNTWSTTQKFYMNNALLGTRTGSGVGGCDMYYIGYPSHSYTQYFSEIIMYRNAQTSNISNINNAINTYYSIY